MNLEEEKGRKEEQPKTPEVSDPIADLLTEEGLSDLVTERGVKDAKGVVKELSASKSKIEAQRRQLKDARAETRDWKRKAEAKEAQVIDDRYAEAPPETQALARDVHEAKRETRKVSAALFKLQHPDIKDYGPEVREVLDENPELAELEPEKRLRLALEIAKAKRVITEQPVVERAKVKEGVQRATVGDLAELEGATTPVRTRTTRSDADSIMEEYERELAKISGPEHTRQERNRLTDKYKERLEMLKTSLP